MNYQPVAVVLVLGHWSVKYTLKRMMGLNKVKVSWEKKVFSLKVVEFLKIAGFSQLSGCLLLCSNGFPVSFGSGWGSALGFMITFYSQRMSENPCQFL